MEQKYSNCGICARTHLKLMHSYLQFETYRSTSGFRLSEIHIKNAF